MAHWIVATSLGALIGLVLALTGAGGGVLAIPLLVFGLHLPVQQAFAWFTLMVALLMLARAFGWITT